MIFDFLFHFPHLKRNVFIPSHPVLMSRSCWQESNFFRFHVYILHLQMIFCPPLGLLWSPLLTLFYFSMCKCTNAQTWVKCPLNCSPKAELNREPREGAIIFWESGFFQLETEASRTYKITWIFNYKIYYQRSGQDGRVGRSWAYLFLWAHKEYNYLQSTYWWEWTED